jgi:hypothetical protein
LTLGNFKNTFMTLKWLQQGRSRHQSKVDIDRAYLRPLTRWNMQTHNTIYQI